MFNPLKIQTRRPVKWQGALLFLVSALTSHAFSQDYNFRNFTSSDGLAQSYVYSIMQDERGYLWIGTGDGLSRYNGFIFDNYSTSDSLADNFISCGISDGGSMWFGHMNGGLSYYNGKNFQVIHMPLSDLSPITHFAKSPDGSIWAGTYAGNLLKLDKGKGVIKVYSLKVQESILTFDFLNENELLAGTNAGLIYCLLKNSGEIEIARAIAEIPESKVMDIIKMRSGSGFYIATDNEGIFRLNHENNRIKIEKLTSDTGYDFSSIQCIYEDYRSNLWLGTFGNGLIKMGYSSSGALTVISKFNKAAGFATDNVKVIIEDHDGNIWSGNYGDGLTQITAKIFTIYTFDKVMHGKSVFSIYTDKQFRWIGTENGLLKMEQMTGKIVRFYNSSSGLPRDIITAIYSTNGKELWIGTEENGVFRMNTDHEKISRYPIGTGELENSVTAITGNKEQVWIGTKKGLCNIHSGSGKIKWYSISQGGLPHNFINCLYIDRSGRLWISSHSNTLAYIRENKVYKLPIKSGNGTLLLGPITEDSDSRIWIGSNGNGVFRIAFDSVTNITTREGLFSDFCYSIICDDSDHLWVGHKGGISKIRTTDYFVKPIYHFESITDNYQFNPNAICKDHQGRILLGSDNGLVSYDPSMEISQSRSPLPEITSLKINEEERDYSKKIMLKPGKYKVQIDFLAVNLKEPTLVTYQYKLEGYSNWSEITNNNSITYDRLPEGEYTFILNASSGDGIVSENPVIISIIIKKPVWKQWWFYTLIILLLVILVFIYIKRREYKFMIEKRKLEEKVQERTREIQCQKDELELQRDMINRKNSEIMSSIMYACNIQQAVLPSSELLDKLLPEYFIFLKPKDIVSGDFYWITEKDNKIIFALGDCTGHGVPGAFMSLLGITLLNEIVNMQGITRSDAIVTNLRDGVIHSLQQNRKDIANSDGMDLALCVLDPHQKRIQYTGALNDLVYIRDGKLNVVSADHFSVSVLSEDSGPFTMKEIYCKEGDILYLFSDGYQDQFGGNFDKKYLSHRFYNTLIEIHEMPMRNQRAVLEEKLSEWMNDTIQTDDITVIGIRL